MSSIGEKASRMLLRHGPEVALYRVFPMQMGEVETFFNTLRLTTNISDNNSSGSEGEATYGTAPGISSTKSNVKALTSMDGSWRSAFNDTVGRVLPKQNDTCPRLEVMNNKYRVS